MVKITYNGHSCFEFESDDKNIIIDPFLKGNPNALKSPRDVKADMVIVTHAHGDHFGQSDIICKNNKNCVFVSTFEVVNYASRKKSIKNVHPLHIGGQYDFGFCKVKLTQALHSSSDEDNNTIGVSAGIILKIGGKNIYHAGDTGLFSDMKLIGERENIDIALLPIGDNFTMGIDDAAFATKLLNCKIVIPMHYKTFPVINVNPNDFVKKIPKNIDAIVMDIGKTKEF